MVSWRWRRKSVLETPKPVESQTPTAPIATNETKDQYQREAVVDSQPEKQSALLLHAIRQPYEVTEDYAVPEIQNDAELLVKVKAAGLNPIDWKSP